MFCAGKGVGGVAQVEKSSESVQNSWCCCFVLASSQEYLYVTPPDAPSPWGWDLNSPAQKHLGFIVWWLVLHGDWIFFPKWARGG